MAITTNCSGCGKTLAVADEFAGRQARCPACGQIYTVPSPASSNPTAPQPTAPPAAPASFDAPLDLGLPAQSGIPTSTTPSFSTPSPTPAPTGFNSNSDSGTSGVQYWMKAGNGAEYGPADAATLGRWFTEGRVGPDYQIRIGQFGHWQPAAAFQSMVTGQMTMPETGANPYATQSTNFAPGIATNRTYPKADQSGLVLAMGILSWVGGCAIFGVIAWVVGAQALADINAGRADPASRGVVQVGYYLGMVNVILCILCVGMFMLSLLVSAM